jgi:hypothetical protein
VQYPVFVGDAQAVCVGEDGASLDLVNMVRTFDVLTSGFGAGGRSAFSDSEIHKVLRCGCNRYWHSFRDHAKHGLMCNKMYDHHCFFGMHRGSNKCTGLNKFPFLFSKVDYNAPVAPGCTCMNPDACIDAPAYFSDGRPPTCGLPNGRGECHGCMGCWNERGANDRAVCFPREQYSYDPESKVLRHVMASGKVTTQVLSDVALDTRAVVLGDLLHTRHIVRQSQCNGRAM